MPVRRAVVDAPAHRSPLAGAGRKWPDAAGISAVVAMALAYLSPSLKDGFFFGPYDAAANETIGHPAPIVLHNRLNGDLINQGIPWNTLDWRSVHAGHLPLWNPFNVLGLPQLFNFESAAFSLPDLASYSVPLHYAWIVIALVKLLVAGTGAYLLCRQLGCRPLAAAFGGISFMLSGGFASELGWSLSGVAAFAPFICAFLLLAYRDQRRRHVVGLAVSVMFAFFGGFPEMYALLAAALAGFCVAGALALLATRRRPSLAGSRRCLLGLAAGSALACPLLLPGYQLIRGSTYRALATLPNGTPISRASFVISQGYYGLPIKGSVPFRGVNFYETVAYVGILALALAIVGIVLAFRQASVLAVGAFTLVSLLATYRFGSFNLVAKAFGAIGVTTIHPSWARLLLDLGLGALGAVGLEQVLGAFSPPVRATLVTGCALGAGIVGALCWSSAAEHLTGVLAAERFDSLIWPVGMAVGLLAAAATLVATRGRATLLVGTGLVAVQAAFLLFAGVGMNSYSATGPPQYPAVLHLRQLVGNGIVGLDGGYGGARRSWPGIGLYPNLNIVYGVAQFAAHDPLLPVSVGRAFPVASATPGGASSLSGLDIPSITTAAEARRYGISYLLLVPGIAQPAGTSLVTDLSGERLVRVQGAERFSFESAAGARAGRVVSWSQPADATWRIRVDAPGRQPASRRLILRITKVPGFHVSDGGRSLAVHPYGQFEMVVTVPRGVSAVTVSYWPRAFTEGLGLAAFAVVVLAVFCIWPSRRSASRRGVRRGSPERLRVPA